MLNATVIVSDCEVESRHILTAVMQDQLGYEVIAVSSPEEILETLYASHQQMPEAILMDVASENQQLEMHLNTLKLRFPYMPIIALTDYGSMKQAAAALKAGAIDYLARPVSHQRLKVSVDNAIRIYRLSHEVSRLRRAQATQHDLDYLPVNNPRLQRLLKPIALNANAYGFCGEVGVGKEAIARAVHYQSKRQNHAFVSLNCAPLAELQAWNILFGNVKQQKQERRMAGKLAGALGGTLFLNHVESLSIEAQTTLIEQVDYASNFTSSRSRAGEKGICLMVSADISAEQFAASPKICDALKQRVTQNLILIPA